MDKKCIVLIVLMCSGCRIGMESVNWELKELGSNIQTNKVSIYDPPSYVNSDLPATTDISGEEYSSFDLKLGVFHSFGDDKLKLNVGVDARINMTSEGTADQDDGLFGTIQPISNATPVFTQIIADGSTIIPYVGLERKWNEDFSIRFDIGFPNMKWKANSGKFYSEWGNWPSDYNVLQSDTWNGWGIRYEGSVVFGEDSDGGFVISAFYESYDPEFAGEKAKIFGSGIFFGFQGKF